MASGAGGSFVITGSHLLSSFSLSPSHSIQEMVCRGLLQHHCSTPWLDSGHVELLHVEHLGLVAVSLIGPASYEITTIEDLSPWKVASLEHKVHIQTSQ